MNVLFCGRKDVSARCLAYLAARDDVTVVGVLTDGHLAHSPTAAKARELKLPLLDYESVAELVNDGSLAFDLCVSMLYWRILKGCFIEHPRLGAINFHPAPLPQYKGCGGYNLAILEGREDWGVSAHYVNEGIDSGPIIEVDCFPISRQAETAASLEQTCRGKLFEQFVRIIERVIDAGSLLPTKPNVGGTYVSRAQMEAMKQVSDTDDIARKIRAFWFPPYDGATIELGGSRYTLVDEFILKILAPEGSTSLFSRESKQHG
jgi:methionyl-tRNA formyltransferase